MKTWDEAVLHWRTGNVFRTKKWQDDEAMILRWLGPHLDGLPLDQIGAMQIHAIRVAKTAEGVTAYTVNAYLSVVRAILRAAAEWGWIDKVPTVKLLRRPPPSVKHITPEQARKFLVLLPPHTRDVAAFSLETGVRKRNATGLLWSWVDLHDRMVHIPAAEAKGRRPISLPLSNIAMEILERWQGRHLSHVFHYQGRPIKEVNTKAYRAARVAAGLGRFRWHDLRHTWASWHAMSGTPLLVLQQLGGWNTVQMVQNYAHLQSAGLRPWVEQVGRWTQERRGPPVRLGCSARRRGRRCLPAVA